GAEGDRGWRGARESTAAPRGAGGAGGGDRGGRGGGRTRPERPPHRRRGGAPPPAATSRKRRPRGTAARRISATIRGVNTLRAVCVGGGLGAPTVMAGLRRHTDDITGLIAVTDSGRSTGKVRIALVVSSPGEIRSALTVLAEGDPALVKLCSPRFATDKREEL